MIRWSLAVLIAMLAILAPAKQPAAISPLGNILGAFGNERRGEDGRVKIDEMVSMLKDLGVNTYLWHIWNAPTDWVDLKLFLPKAAQSGIDVWVVIGPSNNDSPDGKTASEPFKGDYGRWAEEIAKLSITHPNLKAWVLERFSARYCTAMTPDAVREVQAKAKGINPKQGAFETGFGGVPEPGKRRFSLPLIVMTGAESVGIPLQACRDGKCEGVVINSLAQDLRSIFSDEVRISFRGPVTTK